MNADILLFKNNILALNKINFDFKKFTPSLFKDIRLDTLNSYIENIRSITQADYGEFDSMRIHEYAYALRDLNSIQAESLLSTQGLNQTQIVETLAIKDSINARKELKSLDSDLTKNTKAATPAMSEWKATLKSTTTLIWDQVKAIGSWLTKTPAGWATLTVAGLAAVIAGINAYNKSIDNAVTNAQDKLTETEGLLSSLSSERDTIIQKIKELEELERNGSLSIVEKTDLQSLKDQNEALRIRQMYLNKQQEAESQELVEAAKKKYNRDYGYQELSRESIDTYKEAFAEKTAVPQQTSSYLTGGTSNTSPSYAPGIEAQQAHTESQSLAALIAKYEHLTEAKKKASQAGDRKALEEYEAQLTDASQELYNKEIKLQEFFNQLSASGETSAELDDINNKLKLINNTLYANEKAAFHFINDKFFQSDKKKLVELSETTTLTEEELEKNYSDIASYIKENGLSINDLNSVIKTYKDELISTVPTNANNDQMIESAKNHLYSHFISTPVTLNETDLTQATEQYEDWISKFSNDDIVLLYTIMNDSDTSGWSFEDYDLEVEKRKNSFSDLFSSLPKEKLEEYVSLLNSGKIDEKTISSYSELSTVMNQTGLSFDEFVNRVNAFSLDTIQSSVDELTGVLEKTKNGELFSSDEIAALIIKHSELASSVIQTADGYTIERSAIESLISAYGDNERAMLLYQMHNTQSAIEGTKARIEQYQTELNILLEMAGVMGGFDSYGEMLGTVNGSEQAAYSKYGIDAVKKTKDLSALQTSYKVLERKLQKSADKVAALNASTPKSPGSGSDPKSTPSEEKPTEFDWLKSRNEYLQKEHDTFKKILDDETQSYEEQIDAIDNLIAKDKERLEASTAALTTYQNKWATASAKLSQEDIDNIMYGNDFIGEHKGQYAKDLQDAADIYKEMISHEEDITNLNQEEDEHLRKQLQLRGEIIQAQQDEINSQMNLLQSRMDLTEARGGVVSERMLQKQLHLSESLMDSYQDKIDNLYDQISNVDPDSAAYHSLLSQINDCESAIIDCQIQQEEWNEKILRLPIERIQKYLNMLAGIKQDLQNFLDEQSAMGINPTADQLQQLFDISQEEIKSLLKQQGELKNLLDRYTFGSEKFNDVSQELQDIDNTISGLIQSQKEWNASILQIPVDQMSKLNDTLNLASSTLDDILSDYDSALSAVTGVIDQQTESLEDLKSAAEKSYQAQIDPLQEELDLLQKQNEERQTQLDLEQRQYDLDRARNQKSTQVIRNGEMIYEADADAIRSASQGLADAQYNKLVKDLKDQISALESERDNLLEGYDSQIEKLNEIKEKWSSIVDDIQMAADLTKANTILGKRILSSSSSIYITFV